MPKHIPNKKILHKGKFLQLVEDATWEYAERPNASGVVVILALTSDNKVLFVEQYRVPVGKNVIELPAGLAGDIKGQENESLKIAALRELEEETGYTADDMELLIQGPGSSGSSSTVLTFYRAKGLKKVGPGGGDKHEEITVHEVELENVEDWLKYQQARGMAIDPKIFTGLYFLKND